MLPSPSISNKSFRPSNPLSEVDDPLSHITQTPSSSINVFSTSNNVFPEFTTSCETPPTLDQIDPNNNNNNNKSSDKPVQSIETPNFYTNPLSSLQLTNQLSGLSDLDRMLLQNYNQDVDLIQTSLPNSTPLQLTSLPQQPASITLPRTHTLPVSHSALLKSSPSPSPFPGSTQLQIEPLKLSPKYTQEFSKLLSDYSTTPLQTTFQGPYTMPTLPPSSAPVSEISRTLYPCSSAPQSSTALSQPPFTPYDSSDSLLNPLTNPHASAINQSNSDNVYSSPGFNSNPPLNVTHQSSDIKSNDLNLSFVKYLTSLTSNKP